MSSVTRAPTGRAPGSKRGVRPCDRPRGELWPPDRRNSLPPSPERLMQYLAVFGRQRSGHDAPPRGCASAGVPAGRNTREYRRCGRQFDRPRLDRPLTTGPTIKRVTNWAKLGQFPSRIKLRKPRGPRSGRTRSRRWMSTLRLPQWKQISLSRHLRTAVSEVRYGDKARAERRRSGAGNDLHSGHIDVSCTGASTNACTGADIRSVVLRNIRGFCRR